MNLLVLTLTLVYEDSKMPKYVFALFCVGVLLVLCLCKWFTESYREISWRIISGLTLLLQELIGSWNQGVSCEKWCGSKGLLHKQSHYTKGFALFLVQMSEYVILIQFCKVKTELRQASSLFYSCWDTVQFEVLSWLSKSYYYIKGIRFFYCMHWGDEETRNLNLSNYSVVTKNEMDISNKNLLNVW